VWSWDLFVMGISLMVGCQMFKGIGWDLGGGGFVIYESPPEFFI
jgi:hypothetical protein